MILRSLSNLHIHGTNLVALKYIDIIVSLIFAPFIYTLCIYFSNLSFCSLYVTALKPHAIFVDASPRTAAANSHSSPLSNLLSSPAHSSLLPHLGLSICITQPYPKCKLCRSSSIRAFPPFGRLPLLHLLACPSLLKFQHQLARRRQSPRRLASDQTVLCRLRRQGTCVLSRSTD